MQKVMVQIDWYTKIILTLIVVLLAGLLARPYIESRRAEAEEEYQYGSFNVDVSGSLDIRGVYIPTDLNVSVSGVDPIYNSKASPFWVETK